MPFFTFTPPFLALFPPDVAACAIEPGTPLPPLPPEEAAAVEGAAERRRREFTAGRVCAREALARLGVPGASSTVLPRGADRAPCWPRGILGSISHKFGGSRHAAREACGAVVCRAGARAGMGLDIEQRGPLPPALWRVVLADEEQQWLRALPEARRGILARVIFSAKECLYKAQYTVTRRYVGFRDVTVVPEASLPAVSPPDRLPPDAPPPAVSPPEARPGTFTATFLRDVAPCLPQGWRLHGRWSEDGDWIHTGMVIENADLPGGC